MAQVSPATSAIEHRPWQEALAPYARPHVGRSALDLATSVVPYLALSVGMYLLLGVSYPLALVLAVPATGFLLRTYVVFHDCAHGSFLPSKRGNAWLGTALGLLVFAPFVRWRHDHAVHHATSGDLDRRGVGDIPTITVAEYGALSPRQRPAYRLFRNPAVMFGLGPVVAMIVGPRIPARNARPRMRRSVIGTDIALAVLVGGLCWLVGWREYVMVALPPALLAGAAGIWLFYVQHQFEDAYWQSTSDWNYADAALRGSSYLKLAKPLQFFTGNIGLHHIHHLNARIPNYNLQRARREPHLPRRADALALAGAARGPAEALGRGPRAAGHLCRRRQASVGEPGGRRSRRSAGSALVSIAFPGACLSSPSPARASATTTSASQRQQPRGPVRSLLLRAEGVAQTLAAGSAPARVLGRWGDVRPVRPLPRDGPLRLGGRESVLVEFEQVVCRREEPPLGPDGRSSAA